MTQLNDNAVVNLYPVEPALNQEQAQEVIASLEKLFAQFERESTAGTGYIGCIEDGHVLMCAYEENPQEGLSGCRKDKIAKVLLHLEEKFGIQILNAPPMLVQVNEHWQALHRAGLKDQINAGHINADSLAYDTRCADLGAWRQGPVKKIAEMWMAPIVQRMLPKPE